MKGVEPGSRRTRVVVVGCGFAGVAALRRLARRRPREVELVAFNSKPFLYNYTVLPRTLAEDVPAERVEIPLPGLLEGLGVELRVEWVAAVDAPQRRVLTERGDLRYDYLLLATGARAIPLAQDGDTPLFYPKSTRHLERLDRYLAEGAAAASQGLAPARRLAVIGGGLTGVEFAAGLREAVDRTCARAGCGRDAFRIELFEAAERLAPLAPPGFSRLLRQGLERRGIGVRTGTHIERVGQGRLLTREAAIPVDAALCCIGSLARPRNELEGLAHTADGLAVNAFCQSSSDPSVFAAGDGASAADLTSRLNARSAARAIHEGRVAADNILLSMRGRAMRRRTGGTRITGVMLGARDAAFVLGRWQLSGRMAGRLKRFIDLHPL